MVKGKKYQESAKLIDRTKLYETVEALDMVCKTSKAKFDETVEVHVKLGVDSRHADQQVRGAVVLPHGTGKTVRTLVFAKGDNAKAAEEAGSDFVGAEDMVAKITSENWFDFDVVIATPDMMGVIGRQNDGNNGRKTFGNGGDGKRDCQHEGRDDRLKAKGAVAEQLHAENDHTNTDNQVGQNLGKTGQLDLKGRLAFLGVGQCVGDLTHLGVHASGGNDGLAATVYDSRAHEYHILAVAQGNVAVLTLGQSLYLFVHGNGLTRQSSFFNLHRSAFDDAGVGGNGVTGLQDDNITDDEILAFDGDLLAVADDFTRCSGDLLQCLDGLLSLAFLEHAEDGVDQNDGENDHDVGRELPVVLRDAVVNLKTCGNGGRDDQNDGHRLSQLFEETVKKRLFFALGQLVLSVFLQARLRLLRGKTNLGGFQMLHRVLRGGTIEFHVRLGTPKNRSSALCWWLRG